MHTYSRTASGSRLSKQPDLSDLIGQVSQPDGETLPASLSDVDVGCRHSEGSPAVLLVLSVLQEPGDWLELRRSRTQEVPDWGERTEKYI